MDADDLAEPCKRGLGGEEEQEVRDQVIGNRSGTVCKQTCKRPPPRDAIIQHS